MFAHSAAVTATRKFVPGEILVKDEPKVDLSKDEPKDLTSEGLVAKTQCGSKSWQDTPAAALPQEPASVLAHPANAFQYSACHRYGAERGTATHCKDTLAPRALSLQSEKASLSIQTFRL